MTVSSSELSQEDLESRIGRLIEQLGAPQFATRERARAELERLRLDAFDALNEAQYNDDIEIALSARYLVRSMQVNWSSDDDSPEVKQLLRGYGNRPESERRNLVEQVALLGTDQSLRPLCRLVRYEASERLSKQAALFALSLESPSDESARRAFVETLRAGAGKSRRAAADWLRAHAELISGASTATDHWQRLIEQEQERLVQLPDQTSRDITCDLLKWYADQLTRRDRRDDAMAMMREMIGLLESNREEVLDAVDWFRERQSWTIVVEMADRFPDTFQRSPLLLYRLAETYRQLGEEQKADESAVLALRAVDKEPERHLEMAANLQHDGLFASAEMEYRFVAKMIKEEPVEAVQALLYLSEMLHEVGKESAAGDVAKELVELVEADDGIRKIVETDLGREAATIKSRMHFFYAQQYAQQNDPVKQRESLNEGFKNDPHDADLLIAMHRLTKPDDAWKEQTSQRIRAAADAFRTQIKELRDRANNSRAADERAIAAIQLALAHNQLAWLIANTEGDFDESLQSSLRSLELQPSRSGFLDTLGRCYYAKGDYANAVKYQSQAVAMEPHSPPMLAQLKLFKKALNDQQAAEPLPAKESKTP